MAHPGGRPTEYDPSIIDRVDSYLATTGREQMELPTIEGLARYIGVNADTIHEWKKKYPEFSESIKEILDRQREQLMNDGMYGGKEVNSTMAIFLLKANHGLIEKSALDVTTGGQPLLFDLHGTNQTITANSATTQTAASAGTVTESGV